MILAILATLAAQNITNERGINPLPVHAFVDDIAAVQYEATLFQRMF